MKKIFTLLFALFLAHTAKATVQAYWADGLVDTVHGYNLTEVGSVANPSLPTPPQGIRWTWQGPTNFANYLSAPQTAYNNSNTGAISLYFWMDVSSTSQGLISFNSGTIVPYHLGLSINSSGDLSLSYTTVAGSETTATASTFDNSTYHLVWIRSSSIEGMQLYVDGTLECSDSNGILFGSYQSIILGEETSSQIFSNGGTYMDAVQLGDSYSDAYDGPSTPNTPTNTPTITKTITPTDTPTATPSHTPVQSATHTLTVSPTISPTSSISPTDTPTITKTITPTDTLTPTSTPSDTPTTSPTFSLTFTPTYTRTPFPVSTEVQPVVAYDLNGNVLSQAFVLTDTFAGVGTSVSHSLINNYTHYFSAEVAGIGANNEKFNVIVQGSLDNISWTTVMTLSDANPGDRKIIFPNLPIGPILYIRESVVSLTLNNATGVSVTVAANR